MMIRIVDYFDIISTISDRGFHVHFWEACEDFP